MEWTGRVSAEEVAEASWRHGGDREVESFEGWEIGVCGG